MRPQRISIESEVLEEFRQNLNTALEIVTCQLARRKLREGTISAKIKIKVQENADKESGEVFFNMELEPDVKMKIGSSDKLECQKQGGIIMQPDNDGRPMIASQQIDMNDLMQESETA